LFHHRQGGDLSAGRRDRFFTRKDPEIEKFTYGLAERSANVYRSFTVCAMPIRMAVEFSGKEKLRWKMPVLCGGRQKRARQC
jgi:hypothetical protein